jgi:integrase
MSVTRNKNGQYEVQFSQGGRRVHRVLPKGATREQANKLENKLRGEVFRADELDELPDYSIGEGIMRYLNEYQGKAKKQTEEHAKALKQFVRGKAISEIVGVSQRVRSDQAAKGATNSTRNRRLSILRRVAHLAYRRWGWLQIPIHEKIELLPENPPRHVYLTRPELAALLWKIKNKNYRLIAYRAVMTGLRKGELLGLEPDDIRNNLIVLTDTKTSSPRNVPIIRKARFAFRRLPIVCDPTGPSKAVHKASGGKVRFHDLRHTTASLLINAGVPLYTVGAILGHKSLQTTKRYAHLETKTLEDAMNLLQSTRQIPATDKNKTDKAA